MNISLHELNINEHTDWIKDVKEYKDRGTLDYIACDLVFHMLNNEYFKQSDGTCTHFETDTEYSYWCNDHLYVTDGIMRMVVDDKFYTFSCMYITKTNHIIVEALEHKDIWEDDDVLEQEIEDNECEVHYFKVEY